MKMRDCPAECGTVDMYERGDIELGKAKKGGQTEKDTGETDMLRDSGRSDKGRER